MLNIKLWSKDDNVLHQYELSIESLKINLMDDPYVSKFISIPISIHKFISITAKLEMFTYS